jgi:hypothetical protein
MVFFSRILSKKSLSLKQLLTSHIKNKTILMNFNVVSDIGHREWPKREKIKGNVTGFHGYLQNDFSKGFIFQ